MNLLHSFRWWIWQRKTHKENIRKGNLADIRLNAQRARSWNKFGWKKCNPNSKHELIHSLCQEIYAEKRDALVNKKVDKKVR